jgi:type I restriction enzyme S subunit
MASEWKHVKFSELCDIWRGGSPRPIHDFIRESGIPWVKIADATSSRTRFIEKTKEFIKPEGMSKSREVFPGDLIISNSATPGLPMFMSIRACIHDGWLLLRNFKNVDKLFCYYLLVHERENIVRFGNGSVFTNLKTDILKNHEVNIPPFPEQRAIAHILGSLDDKIELNRRMNETLEATARAVFKSWFVDFDPVRAKAKGRPTGLTDDIAALFPESFEDSELGEIPKGWKVKPIGQAVKCVGGSTPSTKNPAFWGSGKNPFVTPKDMSSLASPVILDTSRHITNAGVDKISSGHLPIGTVILSSRAPIGYLAITEVPVSVNQGVIAMICNKDLPNFYVLYWTETNMETIKSNAGGTTFAEISKRDFRPIPVVVSNKLVLDAFVQQVEPLHKQVVLNLQESNSLASLRDTLLPKLISGELRVPDAERFVEEAGL